MPTSNALPNLEGTPRARLSFLCVACTASLLVACNNPHPTATAPASKIAADAKTREVTAMRLTSTAFQQEGALPSRCTCEGQDISPALSWEKIPEGAKSLVLIVDDPDAPDPAAPKMTWVHWVLYNIPTSANGLAEGVKTLPEGTREGLNDWKQTGYRGPCPPVGRHRYYHKLYALDTVLPDLSSPTKSDVEAAMAKHILAKTELLGTYKKGQ
jgi:hypothetical protein